MPPKKTHREVKTPQITARYLADYMAASETAKRTIVQKCKYQSLVRIIQHEEAKLEVAKHLRSGEPEVGTIREIAERIRRRIADDEYERDLYDHNADYLSRAADVLPQVLLPNAERLVPGKCPAAVIHGVKVKPQIYLRLSRTTKTNEVRIGAVMLRYAKGRPLNVETASWQSAFLHGYLRSGDGVGGAEPEEKLCLTLDMYAGIAYGAPSDSVRRFGHMRSACASIFERWPNIPPPKKAVL